MKFIRTILSAALGLALATAPSTSLAAGSIAINDLFNTGVNASHVTLPTATIDTHYQVSTGTGPYTLFVPNLSPLPNVWQPNTSTAKWISPVASSFMGGGVYTYSTSFTVGNTADLSSVSINGKFAADDFIAEVYLNGHALGISTVDGSFGSFSALMIASSVYFLHGTNTLAFETVNHGGPFGIPTSTGLIVDGLVGSYNAVPEPSSIAMLGLGAIGLAVGGRRLRRRVG